MNLGALVVRLLLERAQFRTELAQTVQETNAAASKVQGHAATITGAVTDAVNGQTTAVQTATRALSVLGPVAATATAAALAVGVAFHQAQQETLAYEKAIILSGNAAGVTSGQLADMARRIDGVAGTQANAAAALASMTAGGKVAQENLEKVALAAIEMERATGQAIGETEKIFSSLGKDPVKASLRLNESMNHLTASTYAQMKAAEDLGDKETAASIAQNAAAEVMRTRAAEIEQHLGSLQRVMRGVRSVAAEMWDAVLDIGRPATLDSQIAALNNKIKQTAWRGPAATEDLQQQVAYLQEQQRMIRRGTEAQAENNRVQEARIELFKALEQSASKQEKMAIAIAQANALADRSGASAAERAQLVSAAREKFTEKESKAAKAALSDYDKLMQRLGTDVPKAAAEAEAAQHGYNKAQGEFLVLAGSPAWAKFTNEQRASAAAQFEKKIASEQAADAIKAEEKATVEATKAREKSLATAEKELEKLRASVVAQEEQNARLGLSKEAIAELDAAKLEMLATDVELQAIKVMDKNLDEAQYGILKRQAQAYRDLAQAKRDGAARAAAIESDKALEKAADKAAKEGEKASERIEQSLTDSLMRGFEAGKDMARNLRDTVVNMFKTMVLRPMVSAVVSPVAGAITGAMGLASAGQSAAGSAAGSMGSSLLGSAIGGMGAFGTGASYGAASLFANGLTGTLAAGGQMIGAGSVMSGLGTIAGALGPIAIGIALLSSLIKKSTPHMGAASSYSASAGLVSGADVYAGSGFADTRTYSAEAEKVTATVARSIGMALDDVAVTFGKKAGYEITAAFGDDSDKKSGAWGQLLIKQMGETIVDWRDTQTDKWAPKVFADGEEGGKQWQQAAAQSVREVIDGMGLPEWAARITRALPDSATMDDLTAALAQIKAYPAQLLQQFGLDQAAMVRQFASDIASKGAAVAGQNAADTLVNSVQNALFERGAEAVYNTVLQGMVTPFLDAIAMGAATADMLSQETIDRTIERAKAQAQALADLYGNADFASAMEQLRTAVGGALGQAGGYLQALPQTLVATQQIDTAAQDAARAADEAQRAWQQITDGLLADQATMQIELLRAQGREEEALARERALAIEGMDAYQTALYDSNQALKVQITGLQRAAELTREIGELLPSVIDQYSTPDQRSSNAYSKIAADLFAAGFVGMDAGALSQALTGATKDEIAQAAVAIYNMAGVTDDMRLALLRAASGLAELKDAAVDTGRSAVDIAQERARLEMQVLSLQGDTAELRRRELDALDPSNRGLQERIWSLEAEARISQERAGLQDTLNQLTMTSAELRALEIAKLDESNRPLQERINLLQDEKRIAQERNGLMTSLYQALGNTGALRADQLANLDPANRALQQQVWQIDDAKAALEKALQAEVESANAAQQAAQERVSTLQSIFDVLKSNVDSLYGSVEATKAWSAAQANAFIDNALSNARTTGYMPEAGDLTDAISGARAGLGKEYATEFEKQRDTLVLAGKLSELQDISGGQLKAAEAQVKALDGMQAQGRNMLDRLSGNVTATISVRDAINNLTAAITGVDPGAAGGALGGASAYAGSPEEDEARGVFGGVRPSIINAAVAGAGSDPAAQALAALKAAYGGGMDARLYDKYVSGAGFENTLVDVPGYADWLLEAGKVDEDWLRRAGVPGFATGGMHAGGLRIVGENGPELEATGPSRIWNRQQLSGALMGGNTARLEALIEGLTARVQALQSELVAIKTNTSNMAENIDEVTEGGNAMRSRAVGVTA